MLFTADGSIPTFTAGTSYIRPIRLSATTPAVTVLRARAVLPDNRLGPVVTASYFVGLKATLPLISLVVEPDDLWHPERGIYVNPHGRGRAWERPVDVTYVDEDRHSGFHIAAGLRIHGQSSRDFEKKALRLYFRQEYGASRLEYPLFANVPLTSAVSASADARPDVRSFKRLVLHNGGQDWHAPQRDNWTLIRNQVIDSLALQLDGCATRSRPALVFINGEPWGIYQIRERLDRTFLADHYGIQAADFLKAPEHSQGREILMGDREHWDHLLQFIEAHDLADPADYAYVESQVDIANLLDYTILQIYTANNDWPRRNVHQFRPRVPGGRWRWMFWDTDHGFGLDPHGSVELDIVQQVIGPFQVSSEHLPLLQDLLENPAFTDRFLSRTADLLNTTLAPQSVIACIDAMAAELEPDIAYETLRWSSPGHWESSIQDMRDFARRRPDLVRQHMVERFGLSGTAQLVINPPASGSGYVAIGHSASTHDVADTELPIVKNLPWQGTFFQGIGVQVTAIPAPGYRFVGWESPVGVVCPQHPQTLTITLQMEGPQAITPRFEAIAKNAPWPNDIGR